MSKRIDQTKIERIRNSAIEIISEQGIQGSSVAAIAKHAGVSVGYLYRHYPGKEALVNDMMEMMFEIINNKISLLINDRQSIEYVVDGVVRHIIEIANQDKERMKFLIMLTNDFSININQKLTQRIDTLAEELMGMVKENDALRSDLRKEDLYLALIGVPMQYLALRYNRIISVKDSQQCSADHIVASALMVIRK